jgi:hypothetical protein
MLGQESSHKPGYPKGFLNWSLDYKAGLEVDNSLDRVFLDTPIWQEADFINCDKDEVTLEFYDRDLRLVPIKVKAEPSENVEDGWPEPSAVMEEDLGCIEDVEVSDSHKSTSDQSASGGTDNRSSEPEASMAKPSQKGTEGVSSKKGATPSVSEASALKAEEAAALVAESVVPEAVAFGDDIDASKAIEDTTVGE